jgi:HEAT repeat protein
LFASQLAAKSAGMRTIAIDGLARAGDSSQMTPIEAALKGERDNGVIFAGAFAAAMLANAPVEGFSDALSRPKSRAVAKQYLMEVARLRVDRISRYAQDPNAAIRADIADIVGFSDDAAGLPIVEALAGDPDEQVVLAAKRAIARLRPDR